jgi:hypothetical protein
MNCDNFVKTKKVGKCGAKIWLGTATTTGTEQLLVTYFINGDEVSVLSTPIIEGNDVFLDLTDPYIDYYSQYYTYYISLTDANAYYSNGIAIDNDGLRDGFIVTFGNVSNTHDRLVVTEDC